VLDNGRGLPRAWPRVLTFVREHPESAKSTDHLEDFFYEHDTQFIARIEGAALANPIVRSLVEQCHISGFATEGAEQFHRLQKRIRQLQTAA